MAHESEVRNAHAPSVDGEFAQVVIRFVDSGNETLELPGGITVTNISIGIDSFGAMDTDYDIVPDLLRAAGALLIEQSDWIAAGMAQKAAIGRAKAAAKDSENT